MNRCSKCNNELIAGARFCNICGTPVPGASATPAAPITPVGLKRTIQPEIRRVRPPRVSQTASGSLIPDTAPVESDTTEKPAESAGSDAPETKTTQDQKQNTPHLAHPPVIPKTTIEFTSMKTGEAGEKQKPAPLKDTTAMTDRANEGEEVPTSRLPNLPVSTPLVAPVAEPPAQVKSMLPVTASEPDETVPLPPAPDKTVPLPAPNVATKRTPGIIRPIVSSASLRQNAPLLPGHTPPNPMSPLPTLPNTPPLSAERPRQADNTRLPRPLNTPAPGSPAQDIARQAGGPQSMPVPSRQPSLTNNPARQQNRFNAGASQPSQPPLHDMPTSYLERPHANGNGANSTAARQELPLFSPESFAYTSKAAQHWRKSWRDLQNVEAGPAEDVSKGQAEVPAPLASRKDSFIRMRAIRSKQNSDGGEKNFGFWVTLFLMVCLIGGLAAYIVYSYLPNTSVAVRLAQPAGAPQATFNVVGGPAQALISQGQSLRAHGDHFGANDPIQFLLDSTKPILASTGSPLSAQSDSHGSFDVTILAGKDWTTGAHIISATDARANPNLSASLDIQVNPDSTPVAGNNNTYLAFTLNGQPIDRLSFTAQLGQSAPPAQRITFTNTTSTPLQWTAAASTNHNLNWLTIVDSDFAGHLDISQPHTMGISVDPTGLSVTGKTPYTGQIVFTINGNTQLTLGVQLTIINATPEMVFSPNPLVATATSTGTCQLGATLTLINLGTTVINWTASPDRQDVIQFVNDRGAVTENGVLLPSGTDGDTAVVTLRCNGVKVGEKYTVHVYANGVSFTETEIVQIVAP